MTDSSDRLSSDDRTEFRFWGLVLVGLSMTLMGLSGLLGLTVRAVLTHREEAGLKSREPLDRTERLPVPGPRRYSPGRIPESVDPPPIDAGALRSRW